MLQASEGGSFSVGNRKFKVRRSVTPPLTPVSVRPLEGVPVTMPANMLHGTDPSAGSLVEVLDAGGGHRQDRVSRNVLFGLCLTTFACGIVTTLAVDRMHARASEAPAPREPEPVVLQTTPIEPVAKPARRQPSPRQPRRRSAPPVVAALARPVRPSRGRRSGGRPAPPRAEKTAEKSAGEAARAPAGAARCPRRAAIAAAPVRATPTAPHKRTSATAQSDSSAAGTEAAPDEDPAMPAPTKKKWVDPFDQ